MCVNYVTVKKESLARFAASEGTTGQQTPFAPRGEWEDEVWQDYAAPIVIAAPEGRRCLVGTYGMVPQHRLAPGSRAYSTMNARSETAAELASYREAWMRFRFCLVPMERWFEPNYESGRHQRWSIGRADGAPLAVAGLWRAWEEPDGRRVCSFTQLTVNADAHPLLSRFHRPGDEKRALVPLPPERWDDWLHCRDADAARRLLVLPEDGLLVAGPAPLAGKEEPPQAQLF
ncbi:SOS response-associated peptidase [Pseudoduganella lutea]|nr:SOS response-associated peptidase family protein [Pseudoduganella lutea]